MADAPQFDPDAYLSQVGGSNGFDPDAYLSKIGPSAASTPPIERAAGGRVEAANINHNPSEAMKAAGNYAKDKISWNGLKISIENAKGSQRKGVDKDGREWRATLPHHYGYVLGTEAKDGDHVDVCVGPHPKSPHVYVVDQINHETGAYDEAKCMICFASEGQAVRSYKAAFSDGKGADRIGRVTEASIPEFKEWLAVGNTKKPFALPRKSRSERVADIVSRYGVQAA